jgi:hypothetical protein
MMIYSEEQINTEGYWISELRSLELNQGERIELNDVRELKALTVT